MNVIITSEHRVGSRWLHYLLADILDMGTSPEIGGNIDKITAEKQAVFDRFEANRIVKFHHGTPSSIIRGLGDEDYKIIGVVRNPRDRAVSKAFHDFYHPKHDYQVKKHAANDFEAVEWIINKSSPFQKDSWRQIRELMLDGYSTRCNVFDSLPYIWTSYEWMLDNIRREIVTILKFLDAPIKPYLVNLAIKKNSFEAKTKRKQGAEIRKDTWRRKGVMLDWINWFDEGMLYDTSGMQDAYWIKLITNGGNDEW